MNIKTEPAGRLFDILSEVQKRPGKMPAREVWADVFSIDSTDTGTILRMLADLIQLVYKRNRKLKMLRILIMIYI